MSTSNISTTAQLDPEDAVAQLAKLRAQIARERETGAVVSDYYFNHLTKSTDPADTLQAGMKMAHQLLAGRNVIDSDADPWIWMLEAAYDLPVGWSTPRADGEGAAIAREKFLEKLKPTIVSVPDAETFFAIPIPDITGRFPVIGLFAVPLKAGVRSVDETACSICFTVATTTAMHMDHELRVRHVGRSLQYAEAASRAQRRLVEPTERATALKIAIDALEACSDVVGASAIELIDGQERPVASFGDLDALSDDAFPDAPDGEGVHADARRGRVVMPVQVDDVQEATITVQSKFAIQSVEADTIGSIASAVAGSIARYRAAITIESLRRSTTRRLVEAQERERSMVAADIHDGVLQQLGATAIRLELAQSRVEQRDFDTASAIIADGANEIRFCARELRSLLMELRPQVLDDNGLNAALTEMGRHVDDVDVTVTSEVPDDLGSEFSITIFRIVQEALTNIQKHAQASHATVDVKLSGDSIEIDIGDDGIGYEGAVTGPSAEGSHLGLLGMRERARMFGGSFSIEGASGGGTEIHATLPLDGLSDRDLMA